LKTRQLWYVRHGQDTRGPFPAKVVQQYLLLGRLTADDFASVDRQHWVPIRTCQDLLPPAFGEGKDEGYLTRRQRAERLYAARRWADERLAVDRRSQHEGGDETEALAERRNIERRKGESPEIIAMRLQHAEQEQAFKMRRERFFGVAAGLVLLLFLAVLIAIVFSPVNPVPVDIGLEAPQCRESARPQINWSGCEKEGAWLQGVDLSSANLARARLNSAELSSSNLSYANLAAADLSYATLRGTILIGANLSQADLNYTELRNADLRHADLRGAHLEAATLVGAKLENAMWVDGKTCAPGSIGFCAPTEVRQ
jgi:uncharacterized protein YjbI with pentapeptide repeats